MSGLVRMRTRVRHRPTRGPRRPVSRADATLSKQRSCITKRVAIALLYTDSCAQRSFAKRPFPFLLLSSSVKRALYKWCPLLPSHIGMAKSLLTFQQKVTAPATGYIKPRSRFVVNPKHMGQFVSPWLWIQFLSPCQDPQVESLQKV